jgi:hypothetical protein
MSSQEQPTPAASTEIIAPDSVVSKLAPSQFERLLGDRAIPAIHNFVGDDMQQWRMTALATNGQHGRIEDARGLTISLQFFYLHPIQVNGPTPGEIIDTVRCVLFDDKGKSWAFVSEGIASSIAQMCEAIGMGPWSPPILVKIIEGKTRAGRNFYTMVPA